MKALKITGYIFAVLAVLYVLAAMISPPSLKIEKSISVKVPASEVFARVICFDRWHDWSPWDAMDKTNVNEFSENPCGVGAWNSWKGEKTDVGKQTILEVRENEYIKTSLVFGKDPRPQTSEWFFKSEGKSCEVTWNFIGQESSFFGRPMNLVVKYFVSKAYEDGLNSLKEVAENGDPIPTQYSIKEKVLPPFNALLIKSEVKSDAVGEFLDHGYVELKDYAMSVGAAQSGPAFAIFYSWSNTVTEMAAGIIIDKSVKGNNEIEYELISSPKVFKTEHYGGYDNIANAHYTLETYCADKGLVPRKRIEIYDVGHYDQPDTSKWVTTVTYIVE